MHSLRRMANASLIICGQRRLNAAGAKRKGWMTRTMTCGHEAMLDSPEEVVALLTEMASDNAQRRHPEGQA